MKLSVQKYHRQQAWWQAQRLVEPMWIAVALLPTATFSEILDWNLLSIQPLIATQPVVQWLPLAVPVWAGKNPHRFSWPQIAHPYHKIQISTAHGQLSGPCHRKSWWSLPWWCVVCQFKFPKSELSLKYLSVENKTAMEVTFPLWCWLPGWCKMRRANFLHEKAKRCCSNRNPKTCLPDQIACFVDILA